MNDDELLELWGACLHHGNIQAMPPKTHLTMEQWTLVLALRELFKRTANRTQP